MYSFLPVTRFYHSLSTLKFKWGSTFYFINLSPKGQRLWLAIFSNIQERNMYEVNRKWWSYHPKETEKCFDCLTKHTYVVDWWNSRIVVVMGKNLMTKLDRNRRSWTSQVNQRATTRCIEKLRPNLAGSVSATIYYKVTCTTGRETINVFLAWHIVLLDLYIFHMKF